MIFLNTQSHTAAIFCLKNKRSECGILTGGGNDHLVKHVSINLSLNQIIRFNERLNNDNNNNKGPLSILLAVDHCDLMNSCPEDEPMTPSDECVDAATDESLLETNPIQSPLQVFAGMGGLALIAERLPMLYPDVMQQVRTPQ